MSISDYLFESNPLPFPLHAIFQVLLRWRRGSDFGKRHGPCPDLRTRMIDLRGHRFERDIILTSVRWYLA